MKKFQSIFGLIALFSLISACTLSLTNVSSNGRSEDLLDQNQSPTNDVKAEVPVAIP